MVPHPTIRRLSAIRIAISIAFRLSMPPRFLPMTNWCADPHPTPNRGSTEMIHLPNSVNRRLFAVLAITFGLFSGIDKQVDALELYTSGHADLAVYSTGSTLRLVYDLSEGAVIDGTPLGDGGRIADPGLIATVVPESSTITVPSGFPSSYWRDRSIWYLPPYTPGQPDLGLSNNVQFGVFVGDAVSLHLDSIVSHPTGGEFFLANSVGNVVYMDTANPGSTDSLTIPSHDHFIWGFSAEGQYQLRFRADATLVAGNVPVSAFAVYTFNVVVPEPSTYALAGACVVTLGAVARRKTTRRPRS
jgi:surface-anchored protein